MSLPKIISEDVVPDWRSVVSTRIPTPENALAWLTVDLDPQMRFTKASGLVLTEGRVLVREADGRVAEWVLAPEHELRQHDHA
eukprot:gene45359-60592_t